MGFDGHQQLTVLLSIQTLDEVAHHAVLSVEPGNSFVSYVKYL